MITVNDISVQFGGTTLFSDVSFAINENDKIALMGKNGAGKSTLLKIIAGQSKPSTGNISAPKDAVVAYLPQHLLTTDGATVMEETSKAFGEVFGMKAEIDEINEQLTVRTDYESDAYMKRWAKPLIDTLSRAKDSEIRQRILQYGIIIHALIDTIDHKHIISKDRPATPNKLNAKSWKDLNYRVFGVYLPFVKNKHKYIGPPKRRP